MAAVAWGDFLVKQALDLLGQAKAVEGKDDKQREKYLTDARADLGQAREKFRQAEEKFQSRLDELPPPPKPPARKAERDEALEARIEAETNLQERPVPNRDWSTTTWRRPIPIPRATTARRR